MIIREITERRSIRAYKADKVEEETLLRILEAGRLAPTSRNSQQWKIVVVSDETIRHELVDKASPHQQWLKTAPILLAACALEQDYTMRCGHKAFLLDLAIVLDHIALQATHEGLGTCWIGSFYQEPAKKALHIPNSIEIAELMSLGYPALTPPPTPRRPLPQIWSMNRWNEQ